MLKRVDCRIGSLEILKTLFREAVRVDCRIGSLETDMPEGKLFKQVDCRIGSLESITKTLGRAFAR